MSHETPQAKPEPKKYFSYPQTLAILEKRLGATDREIAMWVCLGSSDGGIDAYRHVHEFADPPKITLCGLLDDEEKNPKEPNYLAALEGMFFRRDDVDSFAPSTRYISFDTLKLRWASKQFCRSEQRALEAIRARILQSRLADYVPGNGFSQLMFANSKSHPPPEWALFSLDEVNDIEAEDFEEVENLPDGRMQERCAMTRKVVFWLAPNEILIPADQVPGAIADTLYPPPERNELAGQAPNDPNAVKRLEAEREQAKRLRIKFPHLKDGDEFSIGDLNDYLARLGMMAEIRHRREAIEHLDPASRWARRQFEDGFNAVREPVVEARRGHFGLSDERCAELAGLRELFLDHWIELVGWGIGQHESYDVARDGVTFRKWEDKFISESPNEWQIDMERDNRTAPCLAFPCTPAELVEFLDNAIGIHCFGVPDAFRLAVERCNRQEGRSAISVTPEIAEPPLFTKQEILAVDWPMPPGAPKLKNILNERQKWVSNAYVPIGKPGGGAAAPISGSQLCWPFALRQQRHKSGGTATNRR